MFARDLCRCILVHFANPSTDLNQTRSAALVEAKPIFIFDTQESLKDVGGSHYEFALHQQDSGGCGLGRQVFFFLGP